MFKPKPETVESDDRLRFRTYLNYVAAVAKFLKDAYPTAHDLCVIMISSEAFAKIQGGKCKNVEKVEKLLRNAWLTEIQLNLASSVNDFIVYSNHWAPVQMYYEVYLVIRSYLIAGGCETKGDHSATLAAISEQIRNREALFPAPWCGLCDGNAETSNCRFLGIPDGIEIGKISSLSSPSNVSFWDSYAMFLRTTRIRLVDRRCAAWKTKNGKTRVSPKAKKEFYANLWPTSLFDAMYRLRIRSNYADVDSFLLSLDMDREARELNEAIRTIAWNTALIFELLITRYLGKKCFEQMVEGFLEKDKGQHSRKLIKHRWETIQETWK